MASGLRCRFLGAHARTHARSHARSHACLWTRVHWGIHDRFWGSAPRPIVLHSYLDWVCVCVSVHSDQTMPPPGPIAALRDRVSSILFDFKDATEVLAEEEAHLGRRSGQALYRALVALEQAQGAFLRTSERTLAYCTAWSGLARALRALAEPLSAGDLVPLAFRVEHEERVVAQLQTGGACGATAESIERTANRLRNRLRSLRGELDTVVVQESLSSRKAQYRRARDNYRKQQDEAALEVWREASLELQTAAVRAVQRFSDAVDEVVSMVARSTYHIGRMLSEEWREAAAAVVGLDEVFAEEASEAADAAFAPVSAVRHVEDTTNADAPVEAPKAPGQSSATAADERLSASAPVSASAQPRSSTGPTGDEPDTGAAFTLYDELDATFDAYSKEEPQEPASSSSSSLQQ